MSVFRCSTVNKIKHFVAPTLVEDKSDVVIIDVGCNDVKNQKMDTDDPNKRADRIIDIAKLCANYGVKDVIASSVLPKRNISLTRIIREVNYQLKIKLQKMTLVLFVMTTYRGIIYREMVSILLAKVKIFCQVTFVNFLNYFVLNRNYNINNNNI